MSGVVRKIAGCMAFLCLFVCLYVVVDKVMRPKYLDYRVAEYYDAKKNSLDVVFLGSSHMYLTMNPAVFWQEEGIPSAAFCTPCQPFWYSYHYLKECLKTQKPKVVVIESYMAAYDIDYFARQEEEHGFLQQALLPLKYSWNRVEAAMLAPKGMRTNLALGLPYYHNRTGMNVEDFYWNDPYRERTTVNGFHVVFEVMPHETPQVGDITQRQAVSALGTDYMDKTLALAREHGIQVMAIVAPTPIIERYMPYMNTMEDYYAQNGVPFINYNRMYDELGIDFKTDFADPNHLNFGGAQKVSQHMARVLKTEYGLEDKRADEAYAGWAGWLEEAQAFFEIKREAYAQQVEEEPDAG